MSAGHLNQSRNREKAIIISVVSGTVLVLTALLAYSLSNQSNPRLITISGNIDVQDLEKRPVEISFHEEYGDQNYRAPINDLGFYQTQLPKGERSYDVTVSWANSDGSTGICYADSLFYDGIAIALSRDFGC